MSWYIARDQTGTGNRSTGLVKFFCSYVYCHGELLTVNLTYIFVEW